ncbi:exosome complex protein Rrp42 [Ignisphaera sp. 4213-co]|uniref:Exosome complex component Rrp42 n=1 Tax=Ignisphaera cupida TaxID=3050454 RepID=A0ABD4Z4N0_9CREN|nr:exosome complex protein Rrp42 [Ignisphaera sp. 4213-co]MDK6028266.1 exosome complex protein Rrp42 [Ignisphaera sp. 4213-co]
MSSTPETSIIPKIKMNAILNVLAKGYHIDKRPLLSYRQIDVIKNISPNADSSVLVKLGYTQVLAGVKIEVGQPFPDNPEEGVLIVNAEYIPAASPTFEPGPPDENAIELARVIDRSIRESKAVALDKLVLVPGRKVWVVWLDIYILDHDGNLIDASMIASIIALAKARIPYYEIDQVTGNVKIDRSKSAGLLPLNKLVSSVTIYKIGDVLVVDPTAEEEAIASASLTIAISEDGNIVGMQKRGLGTFTEKEIEQALEISLNRGKEIIETIKKFLS